MKKIALYIGFFSLFGPQIALAQTIPCSSQGYTVVFVNGVFDTLDQARADKQALEKYLDAIPLDEPVTVQLGYNPTHLAGAGDLVQSLAQEFSYSVSDYDLQTILMQIYPEVTTRKLLIVGHSQGAYYTGEMYNYLLAHGEPKEAVNVYDVGTPAPKTVAGGKYLNSSSDLLLTMLRDTLHFGVLPSNITIPLVGNDITSTWPGHSFINAYLAGAPDRVVSDISGELSALLPTDSTKTGGCFTPPDSTLGYKTQRAIFTVADPTAVLVKNGAVQSWTGAVALGSTVLNGVTTAFDFLSNLLPAFSVNVTDNPHTETNFKVLKTLYGSSLDTNDVKDLIDDSQGGAVALAFRGDKPIAVNGGFVEGTSTSIATSSTPAPSIIPQTASGFGWSGGGSAAPVAQPLIDTDETGPSAPVAPPDQFDASTTPPTLSVSACTQSISPDFCFVPTTSVTLSWTAADSALQYGIEINGSQTETTADTSTTVALPDDASSTIQVIAYDASSTPLASNTQTVYVFSKPVVINEVAWGGTYPSPTDQWIELKNRTPYLLDASKLTLLAEQGGAQYVPLTGMIDGDFYVLERTQTVFNGFNIASNFAGEFAPLDPLGEQLSLAWSGGDATTTLDETPTVPTCNGWCAGSMPVPTGYALSYGALEPISMERIGTDISGALASNWASNDGYAQGVSGLPEQRIVGSPGMENSSHWPMAGFYCDGDASVLAPTTGTPPSYTPKSLNCNFLAGFVLPGDAVVGGLYHGVIGSSTLANPTAFSLYGSVSKVTIAPLDPVEKDYFIAYWELNTSVSANYNAYLSPDMSSYLTTGVQTNGITMTPPPLKLVVIPFIYAQ